MSEEKSREEDWLVISKTQIRKMIEDLEDDERTKIMEQLDRGKIKGKISLLEELLLLSPNSQIKEWHEKARSYEKLLETTKNIISAYETVNAVCADIDKLIISRLKDVFDKDEKIRKIEGVINSPFPPSYSLKDLVQSIRFILEVK